MNLSVADITPLKSNETTVPLFSLSKCNLIYKITDKSKHSCYNIKKDLVLNFDKPDPITEYCLEKSKYVNFELYCNNSVLKKHSDKNFEEKLNISFDNLEQLQHNKQSIDNKDIPIEKHKYMKINVREFKDGIILNDKILLKPRSWHGVLPSGTTRSLCAICSVTLLNKNMEIHMSINVNHLRNVEERKKCILAEYGDSMITEVKKKARYHCPLCNISLKPDVVKNHCETPQHKVKLENSKNKCKKFLKELELKENIRHN